jgi:hypothetical protein
VINQIEPNENNISISNLIYHDIHLGSQIESEFWKEKKNLTREYLRDDQNMIGESDCANERRKKSERKEDDIN